MTASRFLHEGRAYGLLAAAGLRVPRHGFLESGPLPFAPGEPIVLKGIADELWHKSDKGAVAFGPFDPGALRDRAADMKAALEPEHPWIGGLVCEKVAFKRLPGLPTEALVSLKRDPDAGWLVVCGIGGLQADAWATLAPPLLWPLALTSPEEALAELKAHWLGRTWLGLLRGAEALTDEA
ncbi:MAG TPA: acetate--CoA ligase family protein, partial [Holophagaceae bacterium]